MAKTDNGRTQNTQGHYSCSSLGGQRGGHICVGGGEARILDDIIVYDVLIEWCDLQLCDSTL